MREYLSHSASVKLFFSPRAELVALAPAQIPFSLFSPLDAFHNRVNRINFEYMTILYTQHATGYSTVNEIESVTELHTVLLYNVATTYVGVRSTVLH